MYSAPLIWTDWNVDRRSLFYLLLVFGLVLLTFSFGIAHRSLDYKEWFMKAVIS